MATVLPPPSKRQRTEAAERAREQQDIEEVPSDAGSLRLQFFDETTGLPIGQGPVLVPVADATPKNLELLLNTLQGHVSNFSGRWTEDCLRLITCAGFFRVYSISIYTPNFEQEGFRSDHDCVSHEYMESSHKSWPYKHRRSSKYLSGTSSRVQSTSSLEMCFNNTWSWGSDSRNPILT
jgi:hypothetical protein